MDLSGLRQIYRSIFSRYCCYQLALIFSRSLRRELLHAINQHAINPNSLKGLHQSDSLHGHRSRSPKKIVTIIRDAHDSFPCPSSFWPSNFEKVRYLSVLPSWLAIAMEMRPCNRRRVVLALRYHRADNIGIHFGIIITYELIKDGRVEYAQTCDTHFQGDCTGCIGCG